MKTPVRARGEGPAARGRWGGLTRLSFLALALLGGLAFLTSSADGRAGAEGDPVPLRRVLLPADRLAAELKRAGVLVRLPRAEFEGLVGAAARGLAGRRKPRLLETHYRAALVGRPWQPALVGTARWKVSNPGTGPALLGLQPGGQPFNLALKQPRFENRDALIAEFAAGSPGEPETAKTRGARPEGSLSLLVDQPGEQTVALDWSARAEARPEGLQVALRIPACPVASLELDLPADRILSSLDGALLSGPHPSESADRRLWKVACGGRNQVQLLIRQGGGGAPLVLARQKTAQRLDAEGLEATYQFALEVHHQGVRELACECDPALRPCEVQVPHLESWSVAVGATPGAPSTLTIRLLEPLREGTLQVRCLAPLPPGAPGKSAERPRPDGPAGSGEGAVRWVSPGMRLRKAVPRGETLELWLHPDLRVDAWQPGSFRLLSTAQRADAAPGSPDSGPTTPGRAGKEGPARKLQQLILVGGGGELAAEHPPARSARKPEAPARGRSATKPEAPARGHRGAGGRPSLLLHPGVVEFRARQLAWWQIQDGAMSLTLEVRYEVSHGQLFALPLLLPVGWEVESVRVDAGLLRGSNVRGYRGRHLLLVDLLGPVRGPAAGASEGGATLRVRLRPTRPGPVTGHDLPFPDAEPLGARFREGALALDFDARVYQAALRNVAGDVGVAADIPGPKAREPGAGGGSPPDLGPWGERVPEHLFCYRGAPLSGTLRLEARPPRLRARCASAVHVGPGRAVLEARLTLQAEGGRPDTVDLTLSSGGPDPWDWQAEAPPGGGSLNRVRRVERRTSAEVAAALAGLAGRDPLQQAALQGLGLRGIQVWRITLARPLTVGRPLTLRALRKLQPKPGEGGRPRWEVPLPAVRGASRMDGEVSLHLAGAELGVRVEAVGLREGPPQGEGRSAPAWRTFHYTHEGSALVLQGQASRERLTGATDAVIERATLITTVGLPLELTSGGELRHSFRFRVGSWPQRTLPVRLPPGARLLAVAVDGHWLERLVTPEAGEELEIPVPAAKSTREGAGAHHFEVAYATAGAAPAGLWARLEAPAPVLPAAPATFERRWRLPPGVRPLSDGEFRRRPGDGPLAEAGRRRPADLFRLAAPWPAPSGRAGAASAGKRRQALADAAASLRGGRPGGAPLPLRAVVEEVAFGYLKDRHPLIIDGVALREAGVGPDTPVTVKPLASPEDRALPWEECGLVALPAPPAVLLTSRRQAGLWQAQGPGSGAPEVPPALWHALSLAVDSGHDPSGRFRSVLDWPGPEEGDAEDGTGSGATGRQGLASGPAMGGPGGWSEWEPVAGSDGADLVAVREGAVAAVGLAGATALALLLWALPRSASRRFVSLLAWLALAGVGLVWLPAGLQDLAWWPLLVGVAAGLGWYIWWAAWGRKAGPASEGSTGGSSGARHRGPHPAALAGGAAGALALLGLAALVWGADPTRAEAPVTVYLLPGPQDAPERGGVLAPPTLLARLRHLALPAFQPRSGAVLVSASYDGKLLTPSSRAVEFEAVFQVHSLSDGPETLVLPLDGVQLQGDVLLDGARAHPVALPRSARPGGPPHFPGYALKVRGKGSHKVEMRFRVRVVGRGEDREVQFGAPRLVQSRLVLRLPAGSSYLQAVVKHGGQRVVPDGDGQRLEAELGALAAPLRVSWHQEAKPARKAVATFREAYLWELGAEASSLHAFLRYAIAPGSVTSLAVDLPPELEVRGALARRPAGPARTASVAPAALRPVSVAEVRLRDWEVTEAAAPGQPKLRQLRLHFSAPISGAVEVALELVPRTPLPVIPRSRAGGGQSVPLPLPRPHGQPQPGEVSYLAYSTQGVEAERTHWLRLTGISPSSFAPFWPAATRPPASALAYASTFRRPPHDQRGSTPELRVRLRPPASRLSVEQDLRLRVGRRQADLVARVQLSAEGEGLALVEWDILSPQPLTVASLRGPAVRRWSQSGNRLLVWLERSTDAAALELTGWLPLATPPGRGDSRLSRLELPCLRVGAATRSRTVVRLAAAPGLVLRQQQLHDLVPLAGARDQGAEGTDLAYETGSPQHRGTFLVTPATPPRVRVLVRADAVASATNTSSRLKFEATVDYDLPRSGVRSLHRTVTVRVTGWEGAVRLEAPPGTVRRSRQQRRTVPGGGRGPRPRAGGSERTFTLELKPGVSGRYRVTLSGAIPLQEAARGLPMPDVTVPGLAAPPHCPPHCDRWLVLGPGLEGEEASGLAALSDASSASRDDRQPGALPDWPEASELLRGAGKGKGRIWKITERDWRLRIRAADAPAVKAAAAVEVLLAEHTAVVGDGPGNGSPTPQWLHEAVYWLWQAGHSDLTVTWPAGAEPSGATVDGVEVSTPGSRRKEGAEQNSSPLPASSLLLLPSGVGPRRVYLRWRYDPREESLGRPRLEMPRLGPVREAGPTLWTVQVPPGWEARRASETSAAEALGSGPARTAALELARAAAHLGVTRALLRLPEAAGVTEELARAQRDFARACRRAEQALELKANRALGERLRGLRQRNRELAARGHLEAVRAVAERQARAGRGRAASPDSWERGTPLSWQANAGGAAPAVGLEPDAGPRARRWAAAASGQWLALLALAWAVSLWRPLAQAALTALRWLWPEQVLLVGLLGWHLAGPTPVVLSLVALGCGGRLLLLASAVRALLRKKPVARSR